MDAEFLAKGCTRVGNNWNCVDSTADLSTLPDYAEQEDEWYDKKNIIKGVKNSYLVGGVGSCVLLVCCCCFVMMMRR